MQTIQFSISARCFIYTELNVKTILLQTIQFRMSIRCFIYTQLNIKQFYTKQFSLECVQSNSSIWSIDETLSGATTLGQSGPGSDGNEGVACITQSSSIAEASPLDCFVS